VISLVLCVFVGLEEGMYVGGVAGFSYLDHIWRFPCRIEMRELADGILIFL